MLVFKVLDVDTQRAEAWIEMRLYSWMALCDVRAAYTVIATEPIGLNSPLFGSTAYTSI